MAGTKIALIVANDKYEDPKFRRLRKPARDAEALARVLADPGIGGFEVRTLMNEPSSRVNEAIESLFADRKLDDLLLLHFSCHGVKDLNGRLYFATVNTKWNRLASTGISSSFVNEQMEQSYSRRILLLLDCCYSGAFARGLAPRGEQSVDLEERFGGRGRVVITASNATEYAYEGDDLSVDAGRPSIFTSAIVHGLETGEADLQEDGWVSVDELYDYVFERVRLETPAQTPRKLVVDVEGRLYLTRSPRPVEWADLPDELRHAVTSETVWTRVGVVAGLRPLLASDRPEITLAAQKALARLAADQSSRVSDAAAQVLAEFAEAPPTPVRQGAFETAQEAYRQAIDLGRGPYVPPARDTSQRFMKKLINTVDDFVAESLEGLDLYGTSLVGVNRDPFVVYRADSPTRGKVGVVAGGGSGHEPLHSGFVGMGMLDAACPGEVFTSPTPDQMEWATKRVDGEAGVLHIVMNYSGDVMNFEMAADLSRDAGIEVETVVVDDDVAVRDSLYTQGRRGVAGTVLLDKIAGAKAEEGADLAAVSDVARYVVANVRSMALALSSPIVPAAGAPIFELGDDEVEIGIGIHGEPGRERILMEPADQLTDRLVRPVVEDLGLNSGDRVLALVNSMGGTPLGELWVVFRRVVHLLDEGGVGVVRHLIGPFVTSLEMRGCSVTVLRMDDETIRLWDAPVHTSALRWGV